MDREGGILKLAAESLGKNWQKENSRLLAPLETTGSIVRWNGVE
jgi:hypothetical protein